MYHTLRQELGKKYYKADEWPEVSVVLLDRSQNDRRMEFE